MRLSLLANPRVFPARNVSSVTDKPANPTTPLITTSATPTTSARFPVTGIPGSAVATSERSASLVTTTSSGFRRRACSMTVSDDEPTASAVMRYFSGSASTTSLFACQWTQKIRQLQRELCPRAEDQHEVIRRRKNEEESVEPVEYSTMPRNDGAKVFDIKIALKH